MFVKKTTAGDQMQKQTNKHRNGLQDPAGVLEQQLCEQPP